MSSEMAPPLLAWRSLAGLDSISVNLRKTKASRRNEEHQLTSPGSLGSRNISPSENFGLKFGLDFIVEMGCKVSRENPE
jgi:hypothetical protein